MEAFQFFYFPYLNFLKIQAFGIFGHHRTPTKNLISGPPTNIHLRVFLKEIFNGICPKPAYFCKIQKHKQIRTDQTYFWKRVDHFYLIVGPRGFLVLLANQIFRFFVRVDSWYLWEIHCLNLKDFHETIIPVKKKTISHSSRWTQQRSKKIRYRINWKIGSGAVRMGEHNKLEIEFALIRIHELNDGLWGRCHLDWEPSFLGW